VEAARALLSNHPGMAEVLARDWRKAGWVYARFGITEGQFRRGMVSPEGESIDPTGSILRGEFSLEKCR